MNHERYLVPCRRVRQRETRYGGGALLFTAKKNFRERRALFLLIDAGILANNPAHTPLSGDPIMGGRLFFLSHSRIRVASSQSSSITGIHPQRLSRLITGYVTVVDPSNTGSYKLGDLGITPSTIGGRGVKRVAIRNSILFFVELPLVILAGVHLHRQRS
jgi:hypothetical protein